MCLKLYIDMPQLIRITDTWKFVLLNTVSMVMKYLWLFSF